MDLKIDQLVIKILKEHSGWAFPSIYDAVRVLLTADDNRVVASQVRLIGGRAIVTCTKISLPP